MAVEIPSNEYWGRRFGTYSDLKPKNCPLPWGNHFPKVGNGSSSSNSNKTVNKPETAQAKAAKKKFLAEGRPVYKFDWRNKRVR